MVMNLSTYAILFMLRILPCMGFDLILNFCETLGDRAFTAAAPSLWNKLPSEIRDEDNFERFKPKLKTFLFRAAYSMKHT